jgi:hypothetical protein
MRWGAILLTALVGASGCTEAVDQGGAELGAAELAVTVGAPEVRASDPGQAAHDASAAWIRSAFLSNGHAVVGFTTANTAAWAHAVDWTTPSPTWSAHRSDEPAPFGWPSEPSNFCDVYDCNGAAIWTGYGTLDQVLWTGLDDIAAAVGTGSHDMFTGTDVFMVASTDGGQTFTTARILSTKTPEGDSGGEIIPNTVHASLMYTRGRRDALAGQQAIPMYVIWETFSEGLSWWMTKVLVGFDGTIFQPTPPVKMSIVPTFASSATILAHDDDEGREVIDVAWSERTDAAGAPSPGPACPSLETRHVTWRISWTVDFGRNWGCLAPPGGGCAPTSAVIYQDAAWRPCVGASFSELADAPPFGVNNDRPELAMNRGFPNVWYAAINHSVAGGGMRAAVFRQWFDAPWTEVYVSPSNDPATGAPIEDAWGQSLGALQGDVQLGVPLTATGAVAMVWRDATKDGLVSMAAASSLEMFGTPGSWHADALTSVRWKLSGDIGRYTGTTALELCTLAPCPAGVPAVYPAVPIFSAWADGRTDGAMPEIWTRTFTPE